MVLLESDDQRTVDGISLYTEDGHRYDGTLRKNRVKHASFQIIENFRRVSLLGVEKEIEICLNRRVSLAKSFDL